MIFNGRRPQYFTDFSYKVSTVVCKAWFSYTADAPATWPPVLPGVLLRYENRSGRQHCSSQSLPPACLVNFGGMPAVELCDGSSCQQRMFSFVLEVAQGVLAATSQIHRRHMRTRLNAAPIGSLVRK